MHYILARVGRSVTPAAEDDPNGGAASHRPTPISVPPRVAIAAALIGLLLLLVAWPRVPSTVGILLGGAALALVLSFPVRILTRFMPRWLALLLTVLSLFGSAVTALVVVVPILVDQLTELVTAAPALSDRADSALRDFLESLDRLGWLPAGAADLPTSLGQALFSRLQTLVQVSLAGFVGGLAGLANLLVQIFGAVFVAIYLVADIRTVKAAYLRLTPHRYRRDALSLWDNLDSSLSRYLGGLLFVMLLQGALSALALRLIGVPYSLLLGLWVTITAIIPLLGAWLGAIPALIIAFFVSPLKALLTALLFLAIQQLEGNVLTPRIQGQVVRVHPILVLLAVTAGGELNGLPGVLFAVPLLAIVRVLLDFLRARLRMQPADSPQPVAVVPEPVPLATPTPAPSAPSSQKDPQ